MPIQRKNQRKANRRRRKGGNQWSRRKGSRRQAGLRWTQQKLPNTPCVVLLQHLSAYKLQEALPRCNVLLKHLRPVAPPKTFPMRPLPSSPCAVLLQHVSPYKLQEALPPCTVLLKRLRPMAPLMPFPLSRGPPIRDLRPMLAPLTRESLDDHEFREEYAYNKAAAAAANKALYSGA